MLDRKIFIVTIHTLCWGTLTLPFARIVLNYEHAYVVYAFLPRERSTAFEVARFRGYAYASLHSFGVLHALSL